MWRCALLVGSWIGAARNASNLQGHATTGPTRASGAPKRNTTYSSQHTHTTRSLLSFLYFWHRWVRSSTLSRYTGTPGRCGRQPRAEARGRRARATRSSARAHTSRSRDASGKRHAQMYCEKCARCRARWRIGLRSSRARVVRRPAASHLPPQVLTGSRRQLRRTSSPPRMDA